MATVKISELPEGVASANAVLVMNNVTGTETQKVLAGAIAALSGPVHSVAGRTGAVAINVTDVEGVTTAVQAIAASVAKTAAPVLSVAGRTGTVALTTGDISGFTDLAVSIAKTAAPILSINGLTGAVSLNSTTIGAAALTHKHDAAAVTDFVTGVAIAERWQTVTINNTILDTVADVYRMTSTTTTEVRGITAPVLDGTKRVTLINIAAHNITLKHAHNNDSTAFLCAASTNLTLGPNRWASAKYDPTSARWRVVIDETGAGGSTGAVSSVNGLTGAVSLVAASIGAATDTHATQHMRGGTDPYLLTLTSVSALTQDANNLALGAADVVRISAATTNRDITGFTGGATGIAVLLINTGATYTVTLKHAHTGSTEPNRVLATGATDFAVSANGGAALLIYDTVDSRWRAL